MLERVMTLRKTSAFRDLKTPVLFSLASLLEERHFDAGAIIFNEGDVGGALYVIADGAIRVFRGEATLATLKEGAIFGEMALLASEVRSASIEAVSDCTLLELEQDVFFDALAEDLDSLRGIIKVLIERLG